MPPTATQQPTAPGSRRQPLRLAQLTPWVWTGQWPGEAHPSLVAKDGREDDVEALEREWQALHQVPSARLPEPVLLERDDRGQARTLWLRLRPGVALDRALAQVPLSARAPQAIELTRQALRTLAALHAAGLVHGDLHPDNLLVDPVAGLTLLDLGLASPSGRTQTGCGHPQFAPPQRLKGEEVDPRDDLFSLALSVWRSLGLACPWPDYPAVVPPLDAFVQVPADAPEALVPLLRILASWLAIDRAHRPVDAERALRRLHDVVPQSDADERRELALELRALQFRPARFPAIQLLPLGPGEVLRVVGAPGCGRTVLLHQVADALRREGRRVHLLEPTDLPELRALVGADTAAQTFVGLTDPVGAEQARWMRVWQALWATLTPRDVVCLDDWDGAALGPRRALETWLDGRGTQGGGPSVVLVSQGPQMGQTTLPVPPLTPQELAQKWRAATLGRQWDARLVQQAATGLGGARAQLWRLAGALVQLPPVLASFDRVDVSADADVAALVRDAMAEGSHLVLPPEAVWDALAELAVEPLYAALTQPDLVMKSSEYNDLTAIVRLESGTWMLRSPAVRHFLRRQIPAPTLAAAALRRSQAAADPHARTVLELEAMGFGAPLMVTEDAAFAAVAQELSAGEPQRAAELAETWLRHAQAPLAARVQALRVRALALAEDDRWRTEIAALDPAIREQAELRLAIAEACFRRGDYPACRAEVSSLATVDDPSVQSAALLWMAFAATWQGDRLAATTAVNRGTALGIPGDTPWLTYLHALGMYYAGDLSDAQQALAALAEHPQAPGGLRPAVEGAMGLVAQRGGHMAEARAHYDASRQHAETGGDRLRALNMAMNVATLDHEQGDLGRALAGYERVAAAAHRLDNPGALARVLGNRGNLLTQLGEDARATADLVEARQWYVAQENRYLAGNVACVLAELARRRGEWGEAESLLSAAETDLAGAEASLELLEIRLERAELRRVTGDDASAREIGASVQKDARALGSEELWARATWLLARLELGVDHPSVSACAAVAGQLAMAAQAIPTGKPLLRVAVAADAARALALAGDWARARAVATDALAGLDAVAASLASADAQRFLHGTVFGPVRALLHPLARLQAPIASPTMGAPALGSILAINRRMGAEEDLQSLLEIVMDSAVLLTGAERGFLILHHEGELRVMVARNLDRENLKKAALKLSWGIARQVYRDGERVLTTDAQEDDRFRTQASVHHGSLRSILCVPMAWQGKPIGALYVDNRFAAGAFSQEHAGVLEALADQASIAVEHAQVVDRERRARQKLQESQAEVMELAEKLRGQLDAAENALDDARTELNAQRLDVQQRSDYSQIRGESVVLQRMFGLMDRVRDHDFPVLVVGESGTGKELVARAIHFTGSRKKAPFLAINCAALPSTLLESELFGHVRGAFTGAIADRKGLFEAADGGTLFLDEIGEMPLEMQPKLLRVLQTGELQRVGDTRTRTVHVRVVAATHRNLPEMVEAGQFRADLLFRLRVVELLVPPLRQRQEDIALLAEHFLAENRKAGIGQVDGVTPAALKRLREYPWPGNVRQLETVLKSAVLFAMHPKLDVADLEPLLGRDRPAEAGAMRESWWREATLDVIVQRAVVERVAAHGGNKRKAAETLGIDRTTLYTRLRAAGGEA